MADLLLRCRHGYSVGRHVVYGVRSQMILLRLFHRFMSGDCGCVRNGTDILFPEVQSSVVKVDRSYSQNSDHGGQ